MKAKPSPIPWIQPPANYRWGELIKRRGKVSAYKRGSLVIGEGETLTKMYYVDKGMAKYTINYDNGNSRAIGLLLPGRIFGDGPIFLQEPICLSVITIDYSDIYCLSLEEATRAIYEDPALSIDLICNITHKIKMMLKGFAVVSFMTPKERLINLLSSMLMAQDAKKVADWYELSINLTQEQIGEIIGVNRVTVCRIINRLKKAGKFKTNGNKVYIRSDLFLPGQP